MIMCHWISFMLYFTIDTLNSLSFTLGEAWNSYPQWRSNGRFSRFKEPGPPTVRGPRPTVSLVRQAVNTRHSCKTQVQRDRYTNNKKKLKSASLGSLAFSNLKNFSTLLFSSILFPVSRIWSKNYHCF